MTRRTVLQLGTVTCVIRPFILRLWHHSDEPASPEAVARTAFLDLQAGRLGAYADAFEPEGLDEFRELILWAAESASKDGQGPQVLEHFEGVESLQGLAKLEPARLFEAYLRGMMKQMPELPGQLASIDMPVLGHVKEGRSLAHVLYQSLFNVRVVSLRRVGGLWMLRPTDQMEMTSRILRRHFGGMTEPPKAARAEILGFGCEGADSRLILFRVSTPLDGTNVTSVAALRVSRDEEAWPLMERRDAAGLARWLLKRCGIEE